VKLTDCWEGDGDSPSSSLRELRRVSLEPSQGGLLGNVSFVLGLFCIQDVPKAANRSTSEPRLLRRQTTIGYSQSHEPDTCRMLRMR
jgi:hypothetical protein